MKKLFFWIGIALSVSGYSQVVTVKDKETGDPLYNQCTRASRYFRI